MCDVRDRNIQKPDHYVIPLLVDFERYKNPVEHHQAGYAKSAPSKEKGKGRLIFEGCRVSEECRVDAVEVIIKDKDDCIGGAGVLEKAHQSRIE